MLEYFGLKDAKLRNPIHRRSWFPLLQEQADSIRDTAIFGMLGRSVNITDGTYVYQRNAVRKDNMLLYIYGSTLTMLEQYIGYDSTEEEDFAKIEMTHLPWTKFPVYKIPGSAVVWNNDSCYFHVRMKGIQGNMQYDIKHDYGPECPLSDEVQEKRMCALLKETLQTFDAPCEQYIRLGL